MRTLAQLLQTKWIALLVASVALAAVGTLDWFTGYDLSSSLFYLLPITLTGWYVGRAASLIFATLSIGVWTAANVGEIGTQTIVLFQFIWNAGVRYGVFLTVALLVAALQRALEAERTLSRTDFLTGAANTRFFSDELKLELDRSRRVPRTVTLAYIDLDNFKSINDTHGHAVGDEVLRRTVAVMQRSLRKTDLVARLGGDEFAVLLFDTGVDAAKSALSKLRASLLREMEAEHWPVTASVGVIVCERAACELDALIKAADNLMYEVKRDGKNDVVYRVTSGTMVEQQRTGG